MKNALLILSLLLLSISSYAQKVLVLGDSLTEGYGIDQELAYPAKLEALASKKFKDIKVINGGVSGSTTASGLSRLNWLLKSKPTIIIVALGANDGLRGLKLEQSRENLLKIIQESKKNGLKVLLAGMQLPVNYGKEYRDQFEKMFTEISKHEKVPMIPFLLEGVGGKPELNLADGIHPNEKGHEIMAQTVYRYLEPLL